MWNWLKALDKILRGEATRPAALSEGTIDMPLLGLSIVVVLLSMIYGVCMGTFALLRQAYLQVLASTLKMPALFVLTLLVTFPSLYVFNALVRSRLRVLPVLRLLVASLGVNLAVLASLGPIVAFFSVTVTTDSYAFIVLLNVFVLGLSGFLGLAFLLQTLNRLTIAQTPPAPPTTTPPVESEPDEGDTPIEAQLAEQPSALDALQGHVLGRHVKMVFVCWIIVFGLVGAQMGWLLRPFIGDPDIKKFAWFRARGSNFFEAVWQLLLNLFL